MTKTLRTDTCELRVERHLSGRLDDLRQLWRAYCEGEEECGDLGTFTEYGRRLFHAPTGSAAS